MKKLILFAAALAMMISVFAFGATASADDPWAEGAITVSTKYLKPDTYRNDLQYPWKGSLAWLRLNGYAGGAAELYKKEANNTLRPIGSFSESSSYTFTNLEEGEYTVRVSLLDDPCFVLFPSVVNGGPTELVATGEYNDITVTRNDTAARPAQKWVAVEFRAYGFKTTTDIGTFVKGTDTQKKEKEYYPTTGPNGIRNWTVENTGNDKDSYPTLSTHSGIYHGDNANLYTGMDDLEVPVLNDEEKAKGYTFIGWELLGDDSGKVFTTQQALACEVTSDTVFKAVWEHPTHVVSFSTSPAKGTLNPTTNSGSYECVYEVDYNNQKIGDMSAGVTIPKVTEKNGYKFVGWIADLSERILTEDEINAMVVNKDITLFAKYESTDQVVPADLKHTVTFKTNRAQGTLDPKSDEIASLYQYDVNDGAKPTAIPAVTPKEGYEFVGWYSDPTKDILTEEEIKALIVKKDVMFFAEFKAKTTTTNENTGTVTPSTDTPNSSVQGTYEEPNNEASVSPTSSSGSSSVKSAYTTPSTRYGGATAKTVSTRTGDDLRIVLYAALMLIAGAAMMLIFRRRAQAKK